MPIEGAIHLRSHSIPLRMEILPNTLYLYSVLEIRQHFRHIIAQLFCSGTFIIGPQLESQSICLKQLLDLQQI